ncbi:MAG: hypothetical protein AB1742_11055 [bacterium]
MTLRRFLKNGERGSGLILAIVSALVLSMIGGTFAMLVQNESRNASRVGAREQALYVAESALQEVLFIRTLAAENMCYPFVSLTPQQQNILTGSGLPLGGSVSIAGLCDEESSFDVDPTDPDNDFLPCWPYNEALYGETFLFPPHYCNDGSNPSGDGSQPGDGMCANFNPLAWWPYDNSMPDGIGWMPMNETVSKPLSLSDSKTEAGSQRYTTAFFTTCGDDFARGEDTTTEPAASQVCISPPCDRRVLFLSVVSVGEVMTKDNERVQRSVKIDIHPSALYTGVIDQYVDITGMVSTNINGPIHINGWWDSDSNTWRAFFAAFSASLAPIYTAFDPPELISVSYPEDPTNPDWQPVFPIIGSLGYINWIHLPIRLEMPNVNWNKWLDRMKQLYQDALSLPNSQLLRMSDYNNANMYDTDGDGTVDYPCDDAGGSGQSDECRDNDNWLNWKCPKNAPDSGRIHNCRSSGYAVWQDTFFDLFDNNTGNKVSGAESPPDLTGVGVGVRDKSLRYRQKDIFRFDWTNPACSFTNIAACFIQTVNRPQFVFMGYHEFRGKAFVDGAIGIGTRTPYHTCGTGDGVPFCISFSIIGFTVEFGIPHWHIGKVKILGEAVFNGRLYMADYVNIAGGAVYADEDVIKDEASGVDITLDLSGLLCWLFGGGLVCDIVMAVLNPIIQTIIPWWPTLDLTNNGLIDNQAYLDIDGGNLGTVVNSGSLFTRGSFSYEAPAFDLALFLIDRFLSLFLPFLNLEPAIDPIRIYNFGAIVAAGKYTGGRWYGGDITLDSHPRMDFMTCDPTGDGICDSSGEASTGYAIARGKLAVKSDIISHYGAGGLFQTCSVLGFGLDPSCAAAGIFYSGGIVEQGENAMYREEWTKTADGTYLPGTQLTGEKADSKMFSSEHCLSLEEPDFWADPVGNFLCWVPFILTGDISEFNIRGHVFAGKVGGMPRVEMRLDQDPSVRHDAITREYFKDFGEVADWMEILPPEITSLADL